MTCEFIVDARKYCDKQTLQTCLLYALCAVWALLLSKYEGAFFAALLLISEARCALLEMKIGLRDELDAQIAAHGRKK